MKQAKRRLASRVLVMKQDTRVPVSAGFDRLQAGAGVTSVGGRTLLAGGAGGGGAGGGAVGMPWRSGSTVQQRGSRRWFRNNRLTAARVSRGHRHPRRRCQW